MRQFFYRCMRGKRIVAMVLSVITVFSLMGWYAMRHGTDVITAAINVWPFDDAADYTYNPSLISVTGGVASLVSISGGVTNFVDSSNVAGQFGGGTHTNTQWNATSSSIQLAAGQTTGQFDSRIIDAGATTTWQTLAWAPDRPSYKELPDNGQVETAYFSGNIDMTGTAGLWHMNESSWNRVAGEVLDTSGAGMHLTASGTTANINTTNTVSMFNRAGYFAGTAATHLYLSTPNYNSTATSGTILAWVYPQGGTAQSRVIFGSSDEGTNTNLMYVALNATSNNFPVFAGLNNVQFTGTTVVPSSTWSLVAVVQSGTGISFYVNGTPAGTAATSTWFSTVSGRDNVTIGSLRAFIGSAQPFFGYIDEVAVINRALTINEVRDIYRRGAQRLQFQVRSCDDNACSGETFVGPDGTSATRYSGLTSSTLGLPSKSITNISPNRYFQYRAFLDSSSTSFGPAFSSVTTTGNVSSTYSTTTPTIINKTPFTFRNISSFSEVLGGGNAGTVEYQVGLNNTSTWYYWNGSNWTTAADGYPTHTNTAAEVSSNILQFDNDIGVGSFYFRAFLASNGSQPVELSSVAIETTSTVSFTFSTSTVNENVTTTTVELVLDGVSSSTVSVNYSISAGTATSGDYIFTTGTASIASGSTTTSFPIRIVNDTTHESDETVVFTISSPTNGILGTTTTHTMTILDDDNSGGVTVTESGGTTNVTEGGATDSYTIVLDAEPTSNVTVSVTSTSGEISLSTTTLVFTTVNWSTPQTVTVSSVNDSQVEGAETATITHSATSADVSYDGISISSVSVGVTDNDTAGVTVTTSTVSVTEGGSTATYTIQLAAQPTSTVTITISPDSQSTVSTSSVQFTSSTWNTPQAITVTAVNDSVAEGTHSTTITHSASGGDFTGVSIASVSMTITDNDTAGVTITQSGGTTVVTEGGSTDSYTVVLDTLPANDVTVTVATTSADITISSTTLVFTTSNWNTPQTITVTAVDDLLVEGDELANITHSVSSADTNYNAISVSGVTTTVHDNDTAGITLNESGGTTNVTEGGSTDSYTIVLNTEPLNNVTVSLSASGDVTLSTSSILFTTTNWNTPVTVTVTAIDDSQVEGAETATITHSATSADVSYDGISISSVSANITDNDTAGVTVTTSTVAISEAGTTATYTIQLAAQPTSTVTITVSPDSNSTVSTSSIRFTSSTWNTPVTVTVTATDNSILDGTHSTTITHSASGGDFTGVSIASVSMTITDNDTAGVTITTSTVSLTEGGSTATYTIRLAVQPTSTVTITVSPDSNSTVSTSSIQFTTLNWNTPQTITVTAVNDSVADGTHSTTITHSASGGDFTGVSIASVSMTITDNDTAGVTITQSGGTTVVTEGGSTDSYTVVLDTLPSSTVVISLATTSTEATLSVATLTFTTSTWDTPQTVTVTAVNDTQVEGTETAIVAHAASSSDANYNGVSVSSVTVSVVDNDSASVTVTTSSVAISESGTTATYTIQLGAQPTSTVTITVTPDEESTVSTSSIQFTSSTWNTPVTVTVTATNDSQVEGTHSTAITHSASGGAFSGVSIASISMAITDNDTAGVTITTSTVLITEAGTTATYTIQLAAQPTSTVTITISPDSQSTVSASSVQFTSSTWNTPQAVTVTAADDPSYEPSQSTTITHSASGGDFTGVSIASVSMTITDNDTYDPGATITESSGSTVVAENGGTDSYTIVLNTEPSSTVAISLSAASDISLSSTTLEFTTGTWNIAQTVTVSGVDDSTVNGTRTVTISHTVSSTDSTYNGIAVADVSVSVTDDDVATPTRNSTGGGRAAPATSVLRPPVSALPDGYSITIPNTTVRQTSIQTTGRTVSLQFNADAAVKRMAISNDPSFVGVGQEPYQKTREWDICAGLPSCTSGVYTVYVKFYNEAGVASAVVPQIVQLTLPTNSSSSSQQPSSGVVKPVVSKNIILLKAPGDPRVYLIDRGQKYLIPDEQTFIARGYGWDQIKTVSLDALNAFETGKPLTASGSNSSTNTTTNKSSRITRTLQFGTVHPEVQLLQTALKSLGYFPVDIDPTTRFGSITRRAVEAFQKANKLPVIGVVGPKTRQLLNQTMGW